MMFDDNIFHGFCWHRGADFFRVFYFLVFSLPWYVCVKRAHVPNSKRHFDADLRFNFLYKYNQLFFFCVRIGIAPYAPHNFGGHPVITGTLFNIHIHIRHPKSAGTQCGQKKNTRKSLVTLSHDATSHPSSNECHCYCINLFVTEVIKQIKFDCKIEREKSV